MFLAATACLVGPLHAQRKPAPSDRITVDDGLTHNSVYAIFQDSLGFLWFGTEDGVNKFDGYTIRKYQARDGEKQGSITDRAGAIIEWRNEVWVGWDLEGMTRYNRSTDSFERWGLPARSAAITSFMPMDSGQLFVGTTGGLSILTEEKNSFRLSEMTGALGNELRNRNVAAMCKGLDGAYYFGTPGGLFRWEPRTDRISRFSGTKERKSALSCDTVRALLCDSLGSIWIGTRRGLDRYDPLLKAITKGLIDGIEVTSLGEDLQQGLWAGTRDRGVFVRSHLRFASESSTPFLPLETQRDEGRSCCILALYGDRFGSVWIGTHADGVRKFTPGMIRFAFYQSQHTGAAIVKENAVWSFCQPARDPVQRILVGTGASLREMDLASGNCIRSWQCSEAVRAILEDSSGGRPSFWVATLRAGVYKVERTATGFTDLSHILRPRRDGTETSIYALFKDTRGLLWIGTNGSGVLSYDQRNGVLTPHPLYLDHESVAWITTIVADDRGRLLLGTWRHGLVRLDPATDGYQRVPLRLRNGIDLSATTVFAIRPDASNRGIVWLGTDGHGLVKADLDTGNTESWDESDGLSNDTVYGVEQDASGMLWLTTSIGLSRFNPSTGTITKFFVADGLTENGFNLGAAYTARDGRIFIGGDKGFSAFDPSGTFNAIQPTIVVTSVRSFAMNSVGTPPFSSGSPLTLPYDQRLLSFSFVALHTKDPSKNLYRWTMEGLDSGWTTPSTVRQANYAYLPPGRYVLKIRASNSDGEWTREPFSLVIDVSPPFWMEPWFWACMIAIVLASALLTQRYRIQRALRIERAMTFELEQLRRKMAADFHDELGARAAKISMTASVLEQTQFKAGKTLTTQLRRLSGDANALIHEMREMIWQMDPAKDSLRDLAEYLKNFSDGHFESTEIAFRLMGLTPEFERIHLTTEWRMNLARIFKEALTNVVRHATGARNSTLVMSFEDGILILELSDDGKGFDPAQITAGHGISNMRRRAKTLKGILTITGSPGTGTCIHFSGKPPVRVVAQHDRGA